MLDQGSPITTSRIFRVNGDVLYLENTITLISDYALAFDSIIIDDEHDTPIKVSFQHLLRFISQKQKRHILLSAVCHPAYFQLTPPETGIADMIKTSPSIRKHEEEPATAAPEGEDT